MVSIDIFELDKITAKRKPGTIVWDEPDGSNGLLGNYPLERKIEHRDNYREMHAIPVEAFGRVLSIKIREVRKVIFEKKLGAFQYDYDKRDFRTWNKYYYRKESGGQIDKCLCCDSDFRELKTRLKITRDEAGNLFMDGKKIEDVREVILDEQE